MNNTIGLTVLVVVPLTTFLHGAWIAIAAMIVLFLIMQGSGGTTTVFAWLDADTTEPRSCHRGSAPWCWSPSFTRRRSALSAHARASPPAVLEALTVDVDPEETKALVDQWDITKVTIPLKVLASPCREITKPIIEYVKSIRREGPRDVVTVYIPEYVLSHWWENLLHNQSALRLKAGCCSRPGSWPPACSGSCTRRSTRRGVRNGRRQDSSAGGPGAEPSDLPA